ncbi:MAG: hypothetical protein L6R37_008408, partial [Teloschistes peruensis]
DNGRKEPYRESHEEIKKRERTAVDELNKALKTSAIPTLKDIKIGAAKVLRSGDIRFTTEIPREAEVLKKHIGDWVGRLGSGASVIAPIFPIIIDGMRLSSVDTDCPDKTIEELKKQNHRTLGKMPITRIRWLHKPWSNKQSSSLVIELAGPVEANAVIRTGELFWNNETRKVRRFIRNCSTNQCFRCYQYGHIAATCNNESKCGFCTEHHPKEIAECPSKLFPSQHKCCLCKKPHLAWSKDCPERKKEKNRIKTVLENANPYYEEPLEAVDITPGPTDPESIQATDGPETTQTRKRILTPRSDNEQQRTPTEEGNKVAKRKKFQTVRAARNQDPKTPAAGKENTPGGSQMSTRSRTANSFEVLSDHE